MANLALVSDAELDAAEAAIRAARAARGSLRQAGDLDVILTDIATRCAANGLTEDVANDFAAKLLPHVSENAAVADLYEEFNRAAAINAREASILAQHITETVQPATRKGAPIESTAVTVQEPPKPPVQAEE